MSGGAATEAGMTQSDEALRVLAAQSRIVRASQWPGALIGLDQAGLYAWWVDPAGAADLSLGLGLPLPEGLLYVGQAGATSTVSSAASAATLRSRIGGDHLRGKVRTSTLRCSLASVLLGPAALTLIGPKRLLPDSEDRLGAWMRVHLSVSAWAAPSGAHLAETEKQVVQALQAPLNLGHLGASALRGRVRRLRAIVIHGIDDLWVAPDPALSDWRSILGEYGEAFDGYRYARLVRRSECADVADEVWGRRAEAGRFESPFADLRCALFWLQRCVHNNEQTCDWAPSAELEASVLSLYEAIQDTWKRAWGAAR